MKTSLHCILSRFGALRVVSILKATISLRKRLACSWSKATGRKRTARDQALGAPTSLRAGGAAARLIQHGIQLAQQIRGHLGLPAPWAGLPARGTQAAGPGSGLGRIRDGTPMPARGLRTDGGAALGGEGIPPVCHLGAKSSE